jgi:type II secretory pathway pseudopilin PulG
MQQWDRARDPFGRPARMAPSAFTMLEMTLALAILMVAMALVAEVGFYSARDRSRSAARQDALDVAANALEAARAISWDALTPEWAARQTVPEAFAERLPGARLTMRIEREPDVPLTKRVTVSVRWLTPAGAPTRSVELVGLFNARSEPIPGDNP